MGISGVTSDRAHSSRLTERREVYPSNEIPHLWAHGLPEGRKVRNASGSFWAQGDTIYSYGLHFPIARRIDGNTFLVNPERYSVTTGGHQSATDQAIPHGAEVFRLPPAGPGRSTSSPIWNALIDREWRPVAEHYQRLVDSAARQAVAPRIRATTQASLLSSIDTIFKEWRRVHARFGLRCSVDRVIAPANLEDVRSRVIREEQRIRTAQERQIKAETQAAAKREEWHARREQLALHKLDDWRRGEDIHIPQPDGQSTIHVDAIRYPVLRIVEEVDGGLPGGEVETSKGARVAVDEARRLLSVLPRLLDKLRTSGDGSADPSERVGDYSKISTTFEGLRVGCHVIPWKEIRAFCVFVGWGVPAGLPE
jgi:hypothetical protein